MSTELIYKKIKEIVAAQFDKKSYFVGLDIGAGEGNLIEILKKSFPRAQFYGCDFSLIRKKIPFIRVNLNNNFLPFKKESFDLIISTEVIEHLENYRQLIREIYRLLKPGGVVILSTPNVLNLKSKVRYFLSGFFNLFGPLPIYNRNIASTQGHITPIPCFYLLHSMIETGFKDTYFTIDKHQRTSLFYFCLFYPILTIGKSCFMWKEKRMKTITEENEDIVKAHFSLSVLTGRTLIVYAKK